MPNFLWGFANNNTGLGATPQQTSVNLPKIVPAGSPKSGTTTQVNVVRDFYWTYSKLNEGRQEVPRIILTERKLRTNALISQLKYSLGQTSNGISQTVQNLSMFTKDQGAPAGLIDFVRNKYDDATSAVGTAVNNGAIKLGVKDNLDKLLNTYFGKYVDDDNPTVNGSKWLEPYRNLYLTDPTNWVYVLPYFDNNQASQSNLFSDSGKVGGLGDVAAPFLGMITEAAEVTAALNNPTQISYIEKTKFYNYPSDGEDINIEFPLINTGEVTFDDVVRNWQFLFLLVYQNRPGKTSQNTVDQPVIYQAEIPGINFFPFCYVTSISIDFMGARREMSINIPTTNTTTSFLGNIAGQFLGESSGTTAIKAIIPDAYRVRISLKSMTANTKNFMQHMISNHNVVESGRVPTAREFNLPSAAAAGSPFYAATHPLDPFL